MENCMKGNNRIGAYDIKNKYGIYIFDICENLKNRRTKTRRENLL